MLSIGIPISHQKLADELPVNISVNFEFDFCVAYLDPVYNHLVHGLVTRRSEKLLQKSLAIAVANGKLSSTVRKLDLSVRPRHTCFTGGSS